MNSRRLMWFALYAVYVVYLLVYLKIIFPGDGLPRRPEIIAKASANPILSDFIVDDNIESRWDTGSPQEGNETILLDLGELQAVSGLVLNNAASENDYPRGLIVTGSTDNETWLELFKQEQVSKQPQVNIPFQKEEVIRFLKLHQIGHDNQYFWSIHELYVQSRRIVEPIPLHKKLLAFGLGVVALPLCVFLLAKAHRAAYPGGMRVSHAALFLAVLYVSVFLWSSYHESNTMWALIWLRDFSALAWGLVICICLCVFIGQSTILFKESALRRWKQIDLWFSKCPASLIALFLGGVTWILRARVIRGDGKGTWALLENGELINFKEPLDRLVTSLVYQYGHSWFDISGRDAIQIVSIAAGCVYWWVSVIVARYLSRKPGDTLILFLLLTCCGTAQLFFGNVENYSLLATSILIYLYLSMRFLRESKSLMWPALALGFATSIHLSAAWLLGSAVALWVWSWKDKSAKMYWAWRNLLIGMAAGLTPVLITGALVYFTLGDIQGFSFENFGGGDGHLWVPLQRSTMYHKFTLFSQAHFLAILNELLLLCPAGLLLCAALLWGRSWSTSREGFFAVLCVVCFSFYLIFFNPDAAVFDIGILNEWDLFSCIAVPILMLTAIQWSSWNAEFPEKMRAAAVVITAGFVHAAIWILSNAQIKF